MVSSTPRPYFTSGKAPVPIVQEAGWAPGVQVNSNRLLCKSNEIPEIHDMGETRSFSLILWECYRYAPNNDVSVNDGPHI